MRYIALALVLAIVAVAVPAAAEFTFPDTRPGEIAKAWFEAFNSNDGEKIRAFEEKYRAASALEKRSLDERVPRVLGLRAQLGEVVPGELRVSEEFVVGITAHSASMDMWANIDFELESEAPFKLDSITIAPGKAPAGTEDPLGDWKSLPDLLHAIREITGAPAIAAAVVQGDRIVSQAAVGTRAVDGENAVTIEDPFHIGSITKSVTATMIGRLVELGTLRYDLTVGEAFPDVEMKDVYRSVTLEQLLQHRGGIQPYTMVTAEDEARIGAILTAETARGRRDQFLGVVLSEDPIGDPGDHVYSNAGYSVATAMAERAADASWEDLVTKHVLEPLALERAGFGWPATPEHADEPRGHFRTESGYRVQEFGEYELGDYIAPAGDVHMSVADLASYAASHLAGVRGADGIVSAETFTRLHTAPQADTGKMKYAMGWVLSDKDGVGPTHWHNGSAGTFYANLEIYPELDRAVVVITNVGLEKGTQIAQRVTDALNERALQRQKQEK